MRNVILLTVGALLALGPCTLGQKPAGSKASTLYKQGLHAIDQGQADLARACFQEVLRLQPSNTSAKFQLKRLNVTSGSLLAKKRQLQLKKIIIPVVDFDDLTLPEALDAIKALIQKQPDKKFTPNFLVQDPTDVFEERKFTLKLGNLPASVILQYCLENARATARFDPHAIVIRPLGVKKPVPARGKITPGKAAPRKAVDPFVR